MGLKIGKWIKKNVSFKNAVKLAGNFAPGVGGAVIGALSQAHEAKKAAKAEQNEMRKQQKLYEAEQKALEAGNLAGSVIKSNASHFANQVIKNGYDGLNDGAKQAMGYVGKGVAEYSISIWFKENWKKIAIGAGVLVGSIVIIKKFFTGKKPRR